MNDLSDQAAMDAAYGEAVCRTRRAPSRPTFEALARKRHSWDQERFARWASARQWAP